MNVRNESNAQGWPKIFDEIKASDLSEVEKLKKTFWWVTERFIEHAEQEIELARALNDQELLVKEQIKLGTMKHARDILQNCYLQVTGRRTWDE
jgi:hypothetical protein